MARVKRGVQAHARHKKILDEAIDAYMTAHEITRMGSPFAKRRDYSS